MNYLVQSPRLAISISISASWRRCASIFASNSFFLRSVSRLLASANGSGVVTFGDAPELKNVGDAPGVTNFGVLNCGDALGSATFGDAPGVMTFGDAPGVMTFGGPLGVRDRAPSWSGLLAGFAFFRYAATI